LTSRYRPVEPLTARHLVDEFDCGSPAETIWIREHALQAHRSGTSRVYVVCRAADDRVVGYHALAAGSVEPDRAPERVKKGAGRYPIPVIILTRLGTDLTEQGHGLGRALLADALRRVASAADQIGVRALLIHCEDESARSFYLHHAEFESSPTDPLHLLLPIKDLKRALTD
jgi:GNAT superfamily N-acetyltransferase